MFSKKERAWEREGLETPPHVNLIESRQHCTCILGLLQTLGNALPHPVHFLLQVKVQQVLRCWSHGIREESACHEGMAKNWLQYLSTTCTCCFPLPVVAFLLQVEQNTSQNCSLRCASCLTKNGGSGNGLI